MDLSRKADEPENRKYALKRDVWIEHEMFCSRAFMELGASALRTLMRCLQKRRWEKKRRGKGIVYKDEEFIFPYAEAAALGIKTTQFWKNMKQLVELGFIDVAYQGGWYQKHEKEKDYSRYRVSNRWKWYGTDLFQKKEKARVLQPDFEITRNMERKKVRPTSRKRSGHLHDSEVDRPKQGNDRLHESEAATKQTKARKALAGTV